MSLGSGPDTEMSAADSRPLSCVLREARVSGQQHTVYYVYRDVTDLGTVDDCAERVSIASPRMQSLETPAYKAGPWLASGNLNIGRFLTIPW